MRSPTETIEFEGPVIVIDRQGEEWHVLDDKALKIASCAWHRTEAQPERIIWVETDDEFTVAELRAVRDMFTLLLGEETEKQS